MAVTNLDKIGRGLRCRRIIRDTTVLGIIRLHNGACRTNDLCRLHVGIHDEQITAGNKPLHADNLARDLLFNSLELIE